MTEQNVTLAPGERRSVSFEAIPQEARTFQVVVNGLAGSFTCTVRCPPRGSIIYPYYSDTPMATRKAAYQAAYDAANAAPPYVTYLDALRLEMIYGVIPFNQYYSEYCHQLAMWGYPTNYYPTREEVAGWFGLTAADLESGCF